MFHDNARSFSIWLTARLFLLLSLPATAQDHHRFDIEAQRLDSALKALSDISDMQFIYPVGWN